MSKDPLSGTYVETPFGSFIDSRRIVYTETRGLVYKESRRTVKRQPHQVVFRDSLYIPPTHVNYLKVFNHKPLQE